MANSVSVVISMTDDASAGFVKVSRAIDGVINRMMKLQQIANKSINTQNFKTIQNEVNKVEAAYAGLEGKVKAVDKIQRADKANIVKGIKTLQGEIAKTETAYSKVESKIRAANKAQQSFNAKGVGNQTNITNKAGSNGINNLGGISFSDIEENIKQVTQSTDAYILQQAKLESIVEKNQSIDALHNKIFESAQRTRIEYERMLNLVAELSRLNIFKSNDDSIKFNELMIKTYKINGDTNEQAASKMDNVIKALSSGVLSGSDYDSVIGNNKILEKALEFDTTKNSGQLRQMAERGELTAEIIKKALFRVADDIDQRFGKSATTFAEISSKMSNSINDAWQPLYKIVGGIAKFINDNWSFFEPLIIGIATALGSFAIMAGIAALASAGLFAALVANPLFWIAIAIGIIIVLFYEWSKAVGGMEVAWLILTDGILSSVEELILGLSALGYSFLWVWNQMDRAGRTFAIADTSMSDLIGFNEKEYNGDVLGNIQWVNNGLEKMGADFLAKKTKRLSDIEAARAKAGQDKGNGNGSDINYILSLLNGVNAIANNTGVTADSVETSQEDLNLLRAISERESINRYNTAEISLKMTNNNKINSKLDIDGIVSHLEEKLYETMTVAAEGV